MTTVNRAVLFWIPGTAPLRFHVLNSPRRKEAHENNINTEERRYLRRMGLPVHNNNEFHPSHETAVLRLLRSSVLRFFSRQEGNPWQWKARPKSLATPRCGGWRIRRRSSLRSAQRLPETTRPR